NSVYVVQKLTQFAFEPQTWWRFIFFNESTGELNWARPWKRIDNIDIGYLVDELSGPLTEVYKKELNLSIVNHNWAQIEHNFSVTENKFVFWSESQGVHYRDNANFDVFEPINVAEGEEWRIVTRI